MAIKNQNKNQNKNKNNILDILDNNIKQTTQEKKSKGKEVWKFVLLILAEVGIVAAVMILGLAGII